MKSVFFIVFLSFFISGYTANCSIDRIDVCMDRAASAFEDMQIIPKDNLVDWNVFVQAVIEKDQSLEEMKELIVSDFLYCPLACNDIHHKEKHELCFVLIDKIKKMKKSPERELLLDIQNRWYKLKSY